LIKIYLDKNLELFPALRCNPRKKKRGIFTAIRAKKEIETKQTQVVQQTT
jgi:hypothetical protein